MTAHPEPEPTPAEVVDLGPLSAACRDLVDWYDELIAGDQPPIGRLDQAVTTLQSLPAVGGQIGRDVDLIIAGGAHSTHDDIIGAVERLRGLANHLAVHPSVAPAPTASPRRTTRRHAPGQRQLPGIGLTGEGAAT
ncbi:MAG: hypothetical protein GY704_01495 [Phycisphaeraceae bacterium]|nr:hypothetical protein [Phycisphaeraceae bacterium]